MEDALKRLDVLTQEEARMAIAENLRATHAVDERVRGVMEQVLAVDERVAGVDDRVAAVDDRVVHVNERVAGVNERVTGVDERVVSVDGSVRTTCRLCMACVRILSFLKVLSHPHAPAPPRQRPLQFQVQFHDHP